MVLLLILISQLLSLVTTEETTHKGMWRGSWFPHSPDVHVATLTTDEKCDNGKGSSLNDFDSLDYSFHHLCLDNKNKYNPKKEVEAMLTVHEIPPRYLPPVKCLNVTIAYNQDLPTFGAFRPLSPKYGTYVYLPPQRYLHSLAEGAIVMVYHPCANNKQMEMLQNIVRSCLYRHVITPSITLTPERPLALLSWGKCLQMSVVDEVIVTKFIKDNAKIGPLSEKKHRQDKKKYTSSLIVESHLIFDEDDNEVCGLKNM